MNPKQGRVLALFHAVKGMEGRQSTDAITIDENGIIGDKYYGKNLDRTILITSEQASYDLAASEGITIAFGALGENIVIDINPYDLEHGRQIQIGDSIVAITQHCTLCGSLAKAHEKLPELLKNDRGIFAKTIRPGKIRKGDTITLL